MTKKKQFIHIPEPILLRQDLDIYEKCMLAYISSFDECTATNKQFQLWLSVNERTVSRKIISLRRYLIVTYKPNGKRAMKVVPTLSLPTIDNMSTPTDFKSTPTDFKSTPSKATLKQPVKKTIKKEPVELRPPPTTLVESVGRPAAEMRTLKEKLQPNEYTKFLKEKNYTI